MSASILERLRALSVAALETAISASILDLLKAVYAAMSAYILDLLRALSVATLEAAI